MCDYTVITTGPLLGVQAVHRDVDAVGSTERTGIELPEEASSTVYGNDMGIGVLASESFGQSLAVTPLQMLSAVCAATNGGYLVEPYLVSEVLDSTGSVVSTTQTNIKRQVISTKTSEEITAAMESMAESSAAAISGYRIAGKSGTSQINNEEGSGRYVSSMACVAPADDPEIAVLVMVNEPQGGDYYGSKVAAPAVREILANTLPYLNINPEYSVSDQAILEDKVPTLIGHSRDDAITELNDASMEFTVLGYGDNAS